MSPIPRRTQVGRMLFALVAAALVLTSRALEQQLKDEDKTPKKDALYQFQPKGQQRCAICLQFLPQQGRCRIVQGPISPTGWCQYFAARENAH